MAEDKYKTKPSVVVVYTGEGKGKTSAALGLVARALGRGHSCAFIQFIKSWPVGEHAFLRKIKTVYKNKLTFYKGGKGFYNLGKRSAKDVSKTEHKQAAQATYNYGLKAAKSGKYRLVICDEIITAFNEGLIDKNQLRELIRERDSRTSLCLTGRGFPSDLLEEVDIATNMTKLKHHFDNQFLANKGIDY